jgi:ferric-dicitrate binding protein FerR (iron transport regulator)
MSQKEFDHLLQQYLAGKTSPEEEEKVLEWYEQLLGASHPDLSGVQEQQQHIEEKIWPGILANLEQPAVPAPGKVVRLKRFSVLRLAVAACLILLAGIGLYFFTFLRDSDRSGLGVPQGYLGFVNKDQQATVVRLADGSSVTLQPQATLYYPEDFAGKTRDVYLKGDAFFSVHRNPAQHFIVHSGEGLLTEVLGTSFHVRQQPKAGRIEVAVVTGKVWVRRDSKNEPSNKAAAGVVLTPNQKAVYSAARTELVALLADEPGLLPGTEKAFVFADAPLTTVLETLQQAYGIDITAENNALKKCHFTGDLTRQGLYDKLRIICESTGTSYQVQGTAIVVKGKGCLR